MLRTTLVQISMELWGAVFCLIIASLFFFLEPKASRREYFILALLIEIFLILVSDSAAWICRGKAGAIAYWAVRISNYLVFALNYFMSSTECTSAFLISEFQALLLNLFDNGENQENQQGQVDQQLCG